MHARHEIRDVVHLDRLVDDAHGAEPEGLGDDLRCAVAPSSCTTRLPGDSARIFASNCKPFESGSR